VNLLYELEKGSPRAHYVSVFPPELKETEVLTLPITFPFPASHILWPVANKTQFKMHFYFKSSRANAVLASGNITAPNPGYWEVILTFLSQYYELAKNYFCAKAACGERRNAV
jgi:hypothetical protein